VPAATPLPRGPSVLTLYSAADLLTAPGCPVCRYTAEAADRYLGWFALEGHGDPTMITAMCASLGMCAQHTRRLMSQPGAAARLTAVYPYVLTAARELLSSRVAAVQPCPACQRDDVANRSALETLLDGLSEEEIRSRCRDLGGVCLPHLSGAIAIGPRHVAEWLARTVQETLEASPAVPAWLAGADPDAEARAVLRQALPIGETPVRGTCTACLATARAERDSLASLLSHSPDDSDLAAVLCSTHLADAAFAAPGARQLGALLGWQAASLAALPGRRRHRRAPGCPVCRAVGLAENDALAGSGRPAARAGHRSPLCLRHYVAVRAADKRAALTLAPGMADAADLLISELAEAFERSTAARRQGVPVPHSAAWQRAAAFLDGGAFGGLPPPR